MRDASTLLRDAVVSDAAGIARVHVDTWRDAYRGIVPDALLDALDVGARAAIWRERLGESSAHVLVAENDGEIVAFLHARTAAGEDPSPVVEINALYVLPSHARRGLGAALLRDGLRLATEQGARRARLWVFAANASAIAFYRAQGFGPDGGAKTHASSGASCISMARELGRR